MRRTIIKIYLKQKNIFKKLNFYYVPYFQLHGGDIEFDPSKFHELLPRITHVLLYSYRFPAAIPSLENRKRLVSMQWMADVLEKGQPELPWKLAHLPNPFSEQKPYPGKVSEFFFCKM